MTVSARWFAALLLGTALLAPAGALSTPPDEQPRQDRAKKRQPTTKPGPTTMRAKPKLPKGFLSRKLKLPSGAERKYVVFVPPQYVLKKSHRWPVVVFLHGSGECGTDGVKHTTVGLPTLLAAHPEKYPFIAVMPQAPTMWFREENALAVWMALDAVMKEYQTDPDRIYLTGLSMGGFATWELSIERPDVFAAIVPVCGVAPLDYLSNIVAMPAWVFHGEMDDRVPVAASREAVAELKRLGAEPKYTEYPGVKHNSWDRAYPTPELWKWLLKQRRRPPPRVIDYRLPGGAVQVWWLALQAEQPLESPAHIHAEISEDDRTVTVESEGVEGWAIGSDMCPLKAGGAIEVTWNGRRIYAGEFTGRFEAQQRPTTQPAESP